MLREQKDPPCETSAEQYEPTTVHTMLGNPTVTLQHYDAATGKLEDVKKGADGRRHRRAEGRLLPQPERRPRSATPASTPGTSRSCWPKARRRRSPTPTSPANRTTRGSPSSTGSSGTSTSSTTSTRATGRGCSSPSNRTPPEEALREEPGEIILFQHAGGERAELVRTRRCRRKGRTRSSTRRRARTRPSTTRRSTSRTARAAPGSAATTPPNRCANCSRRRCCCRKRRPKTGRSAGSATAAAGANAKRASTTGRPGR